MKIHTLTPEILHQMKAIVNDFIGLPDPDNFENDRSREQVVFRQILMYFLLKYVYITTGKIGQLIGNKNHATVLNGVKKITGYYESMVTFLSVLGNSVKNPIPYPHVKFRDAMDQMDERIRKVIMIQFSLENKLSEEDMDELNEPLKTSEAIQDRNFNLLYEQYTELKNKHSALLNQYRAIQDMKKLPMDYEISERIRSLQEIIRGLNNTIKEKDKIIDSLKLSNQGDQGTIRLLKRKLQFSGIKSSYQYVD